MEEKPQRNPRTKDRKFTPLGIPLETTLQQLHNNNFLQLPTIKDEPFTKASWWDDKKICDYDCTKGHKTSSCFQLKHVIQDLIDDGVITVNPSLLASNLIILFKKILWVIIKKGNPLVKTQSHRSM